MELGMSIDQAIEHFQKLREQNGGDVTLMLGQICADNKNVWSGHPVTAGMVNFSGGFIRVNVPEDVWIRRQPVRGQHKIKKPLGQIALEAGQKAGGWERDWDKASADQRAWWETVAQTVADQVRDEYSQQIELSPSEIRLMAGEMTAQEMRTVRAVLSGVAARIANKRASG